MTSSSSQPLKLVILASSLLSAIAMVESPASSAVPSSIKELKAKMTNFDDSEAAVLESETQLTDVVDQKFQATSVRGASMDDVLSLNRWTFHGNINGGDVENWIVLFCLSWYEPCQDFGPIYQELAKEWQDKLDDGDMLHTQVRFAHVDCTTQRVLCNEQAAHDYPKIVHYNAGKVKPLIFRRVRTLADAEKQARSFLAMRLLEKPPVVRHDEALDGDLEDEADANPWSVARIAQRSGLNVLMRDDMIDYCLLLTACAAAAGLYVTRSGASAVIADDRQDCASSAKQELGTMKAHASTADLLPQEWASEREEITL